MKVYGELYVEVYAKLYTEVYIDLYAEGNAGIYSVFKDMLGKTSRFLVFSASDPISCCREYFLFLFTFGFD